MSVARLCLGAAGAVALLLGMAVGGTGCFQCPEVDPLEPGTFEVIASDGRRELVGAMLVADRRAGIEISYSLRDGSDWVVEYRIAARVPDEGP